MCSHMAQQSLRVFEASGWQRTGGWEGVLWDESLYADVDRFSRKPPRKLVRRGHKSMRKVVQ